MSNKKRDSKKLESKIRSLFRSSGTAVLNYKQIASKLDVRDTKGRNDIIRILNQLHSKKILKAKQRGQYQFNKEAIPTKRARLTIIPSGKGVVSVDDFNEELVISKKALNKALDGDLVEISINRKEKGIEAEVVSIVERSTKEYVGVLERQKEFGFVVCKSSKAYTDFFIEKEELKDFRDGEKVVIVFKE